MVDVWCLKLCVEECYTDVGRSDLKWERGGYVLVCHVQ